eukprot:6878695-Prymnesium_polylepis.1
MVSPSGDRNAPEVVRKSPTLMAKHSGRSTHRSPSRLLLALARDEHTRWDRSKRRWRGRSVLPRGEISPPYGHFAPGAATVRQAHKLKTKLVGSERCSARMVHGLQHRIKRARRERNPERRARPAAARSRGVAWVQQVVVHPEPGVRLGRWIWQRGVKGPGGAIRPVTSSEDGPSEPAATTSSSDVTISDTPWPARAVFAKRVRFNPEAAAAGRAMASSSQ